MILERADDVGGVWRDNTYPGVACDIPSQLYSYSHAPNSQWEHTFARGRQIHGYIRGVVAEHGLDDHLRFGQELLDASWDDEAPALVGLDDRSRADRRHPRSTAPAR